MALTAVSGGWVAKKPSLFVYEEEFKHIQTALNNAYHDWRDSPCVGTKYVWFEHHCEMVLGIKCEVSYDNRIVNVQRIVDKEKFLMFMLRYS